MKIYEGLEEARPIPGAVITAGTFDGVHVGHRKIINRLNELALKDHGQSVVVTFDPHPRLVLFPDDNELRLLSTRDEKIALLREAGVQHLVIIPFTHAFSRLTSLEYIRDILSERLGLSKLVIGYDHHFGRNREGTVHDLLQYAPEFKFEVEEIPAQDIDDIHVSSTKIRQSLQTGDVDTANAFLTYHYGFSGTVVRGDQLGRTIGFPTANIRIPDPLKLVPANGVYAVTVQLGNKTRKGMLNIGMRPTVNGKKRTIEVNIFDWNEDCYDQTVHIAMIGRIRDEQRFENLDALKAQLALDKETAMLKFEAV